VSVSADQQAQLIALAPISQVDGAILTVSGEGLKRAFGRACVLAVPLPRLRQGFYGRPEDAALFHQRVVKEAVHELGHTYGLGHCPDAACVMHFSNSLPDTDRKGDRFCPRCKGEIRRGLPSGS